MQFSKPAVTFYPQEMYADHDNNIRNDKNSSLDYALPRDIHRMSPPISQSETIFKLPKSLFCAILSRRSYFISQLHCSIHRMCLCW